MWRVKAWLLIFVISPALAYSVGDQPVTYLNKVESSRVIVVGKIKSIVPMTTHGLPEKYDLITFTGEIIDSIGIHEIIGNVYSRSLPGAVSTTYQNGTHIFLIPKAPKTSAYDSWAYSPILEVKDGLIIKSDSHIVDFGDKGNIILKDNPSECESETLSAMESYRCRSQQERNGHINIQPMTLKVFTGILSTHLKAYGAPPLSISETEKLPNSRAIQPQNNLEHSAITDEYFINRLEQDKDLLQRADLTFLTYLYKRVEARIIFNEANGIGNNPGDKKDGVVNWNDYPNLKDELKANRILKK